MKLKPILAAVGGGGMAFPPLSIGGGGSGLLPPEALGGTGTPKGASGGAGGIPSGGGGMPGGAGGTPRGGGGMKPGGGRGGALKGLDFYSSLPKEDPLIISAWDSSFIWLVPKDPFELVLLSPEALILF